MKKFLSILLALILTAGMGFSFLAYAEEAITSKDVTVDGTTSAGLPVSGNYVKVTNTPVYCIVIEVAGGSDLNFEYNPQGGLVWNPHSLKYENHAEYNWKDGRSRVITVYNRSNVPVIVTPELSKTDPNAGVNVQITGDNTPVQLDAASEGTQKGFEPSLEITLQLTATGQPDPSWEDFTRGHSVATLTITLAAVSENQ